MLLSLNLTKAFLKYFEQRFHYIPSKYIEKKVENKFKSAHIHISFTHFSEEKISFYYCKGLIISQFRDTQKRYQCTFFNFNNQFEKAVDEIFGFVPKQYFESCKQALEPHQFALLFCESATGIVLETEEFKRRIGWGEEFKIFDSKEDALNFAYQITKEKPIECILYNSNYEQLEIVLPSFKR